MGHREVWAATIDLTRHDGHRASASTTLRILRRRGLLQPAGYTRERRQLAAARRAAFTAPPSGPNQVWQLDFTEFATTRGGTWRIAGLAEDWSTYAFGWHLAATANQHDAVAAVELAITETQTLAGAPLLPAVTDKATGEIHPIVLVTDNGGPFTSDRFAASSPPGLNSPSSVRRSNRRGRTACGNAPSAARNTNGSTQRRSPTDRGSPSTPTPSGSSSTASDATRPCPGTDHARSTSPSPTRHPPNLPEPETLPPA